MLEIRLPWGLLNVTDPSTRTVLHDSIGAGAFGVTTTDGVVVGAVRYAREGHPRPIVATPTLSGSWQRSQFHPWLWPTWETPVYHARLKPLFEAMREVWTR